MAMQFTKAHAKEALNKYESLKKRIGSMRQKAEETTKKVVRTTEVSVAAFGMGLVQGRTQGVEILGVPIDLGAGIALNVFGMMGGAGEYSDHLNALGDGCLAAYATTLGRGVGTTMREKALAGGSAQPSGGSLPNAGTSGAIAAKGTHLSEEELREMASIPA